MKRLIVLLSLVVVSKSLACLGPQSESAQEADASVLFEGRFVSYHLAPTKNLARVSFDVIKTIKGTVQTSWTAIMRGRTLPKNADSFRKQFGSQLQVGLRSFEGRLGSARLPNGFESPIYIVDAACSMNGEDWWLRPINVVSGAKAEPPQKSRNQNLRPASPTAP